MDSMRTKEQTEVEVEKSPSQLHFEQLLKKISPTRGLSVFVKWYVGKEASSAVYMQDCRTVSDRIRQQLNRNQVSDIEKHLPFLIQYCKSEKIDCGFIGMPNFMIYSLHDDHKVAREIFDALSSLDWSNEGDES